MAYLFFFLYFISHSSAQSPDLPAQIADKITDKITDQKIKELANQPVWLRLLHYDDPARSKVTNPDFFASKDIKASSEVELKAFWTLLQSTPINDIHVMCRFPARTLFIYKQFALKPNFGACTALNQFIERTAIDSVSVVFSSYYLYNPSSAFGHSLIKINRKTSDNDLLNYGIGFAANVDTTNPFIYGIKGFAGLFHGVFTAVPYYYKVREYNDYESRDLWSYQLNLTETERELLVHHVWEVGNIWAPYYYFDENCSYWVLRVLEAASPRLNLKKHLPSTHVIPIDSIRALYKQEGLVESVILRPSLRKKVTRRFEVLSPEEISTIKTTVDLMEQANFNKEQLKVLKGARQIDAALDYYDYKNAKLAGKNEQEFENKKRPLLIYRSQAQEPPQPLNFDQEVPPHKFHPSGMIGLGGGIQANDNPFASIRLKPALHDLIDPHQGFDFSSEINFLDAELRFFQKDNDKWTTRLRKLDVIRFSVLTPMDQIDMKAAWRFQTGIQPLSQKNAQRDNSLFLAVAPGLSVYTPFTKQKSITYFLLHSEVNHRSSFDHEAGVRVGPAIGTLSSLTDHFKVALDFKYLFDYQFTSEWQEIAMGHLQAQYYFTDANMAVMLDVEAWDNFAEAGLQFKYYF